SSPRGHSLLNCNACFPLILSRTGTKDVEEESMELIDVGYVASVNWLTNLKKKWVSLIKRNWKFKDHLTQDQLDRLATELPQYMYVEEEKESKSEQRRGKRKRVDPDSIDVMCK